MSRTRVSTFVRPRIAAIIAVAFLAAAAAVLVSSAAVRAAMEPITPAPASGGADLVWIALLAGALAWSTVLEVRFRRRTR